MRPIFLTAVPVVVVTTIAATMVFAGTDDHTGMHSGHKMSGSAPAASLTEPGQGAFAVLSEVVALLESNPDTDWAKVDLKALREHLVDMDRVAIAAEVSESEIPGGLRMQATGDARTIAALKRMVPAHAAQLSRDERWTVEANVIVDGAEFAVTAQDDTTIRKIRALGFFGLMASQDHHREHHLGMALGQMVHRH